MRHKKDLGETPAECAIRECREETGYEIRITELLGVFSSKRYEYVHYPWKENEFTHLLFAAEITGGSAKTSAETIRVKWFPENALPAFSDGHETRVKFGFAKNQKTPAYFE